MVVVCFGVSFFVVCVVESVESDSNVDVMIVYFSFIKNFFVLCINVDMCGIIDV